MFLVPTKSSIKIVQQNETKYTEWVLQSVVPTEVPNGNSSTILEILEAKREQTVEK